MTQFSSDSYCSSKACGTHARVGTRACGPKARRGAARMRSISTRMCLLAATCAWAGQPAEAACGQLMCVPHACRRPYSWPPMLGRYEHASEFHGYAAAQHGGGGAAFCCRGLRAFRAGRRGMRSLGPSSAGPQIWGPAPSRFGDPQSSARARSAGLRHSARPPAPLHDLAGIDPRSCERARRRGRGEGGDGWMVVVITMVVRLLETRLASGEERSRARDDHFPNANHCTRIGASRRSFRINQPSCDIGMP